MRFKPLTINNMRTIFEEFSAGMANIYNSFFISFLSLKVMEERPMRNDYHIPIDGFSFNRLEAYQINLLQMDSINEYVNSIRRHMINDIMLCYERYVTMMYASLDNNMMRIDPALIDTRGIKPSLFENMGSLYSEDDKVFIVQFRHLRNSLVHYNGVYTKSNPLDYTFHKDRYYSVGHEGESITIQMDSIMFIYEKIKTIVERVNRLIFEHYVRG